MPAIMDIVDELDERTIAREVGIPHDEARLRYPLRTNTARSFREFEDMISEYYNYHYGYCVARGGQLSRAAAAGRAKEIIEKEYRRRHGDLVTAYNDAHDGTNGGLRVILDIIAEALKGEAIELYTRDVFDRRVAPNDFEAKVAIIQEFIERCGQYLSREVQANPPERYAQNYQELVMEYVSGLQKTWSKFRRL
jgi:hypothetical protein